MKIERVVRVCDLSEVMEYDKSTGLLKWKYRDPKWFPNIHQCNAWNGRNCGVEALKSYSGGYKAGSVFGLPCLAHRAAWALYYGEWPSGDIDHINGDRSDNRIDNLRVVTRVQNNRNAELRHDNTTGHPGLVRSGRKWKVYMNMPGHRWKYLGTFPNIECAIEYRKCVQERMGFHENHGREK